LRLRSGRERGGGRGKGEQVYPTSTHFPSHDAEERNDLSQFSVKLAAEMGEGEGGGVRGESIDPIISSWFEVLAHGGGSLKSGRIARSRRGRKRRGRKREGTEVSVYL